MADDIEIHQSARALVQRYGDNALKIAEISAGKMAVKGDWESAARWRRTADAIDELLNKTPTAAA